MTTLERTERKINTYNDLRGHGLKGTEYKWVFKVTPTLNNHLNIRILLKPMSAFSMLMKSHYTDEITIDMSKQDFLSTMTSALDRIRSVEHVKRIVSDQEL